MTCYCKITLLLFVSMLCIPTHLWSEESNISNQTQIIPEDSDKSIDEVHEDLPGSRTIDKQVIISKFKLCTIFLAIAGTIGYFIKKRGIPSRIRKNEFSHIQIREEKHLGQGLSLLLLKVQNQNMLISKQNGRLEFLATLAPEDTSPARQVVSHSVSPKSHMTTSEDILPAERQHASI